ncbi:ImmA/IrrE family metallo-endopeptidase [Paenarthrobacter sp. TA1.8]|uniref:ImmA/IrrE family metallo-endopeptidase n=1 Tax=Paenarthrobacter sp. TA1.8 TaxID=3400219 RepID=UPI003B42B1CE
MATEFAPVTPSVLKWARESVGAGIADAAQRAGVTEDRILLWESGDQEPTVAKARALAKLYQRPFSVLFLPEPPVHSFATIRDFRRLPGTSDHSWSRPLHKLFGRAQEQQRVAIELLEDDGVSPESLVPAASTQMSPELAARNARAALGVSLNDQFSWKRPEQSFAGWLGAVEELGVFVLRSSDVAPAEMRGFSLTGAVPVIVVNALDWPRGQVYTLLHEFAHLMLREGGLCDLMEPSVNGAMQIEAWCNAVAAAALMPATAFLDNKVLHQPGVRDWDDDVLLQLSRRWGVSQEAIARRLLTLNRATPEYYAAKREQFQRIYDELRDDERQRRRTAPSKGGPPPHRMAIRDQGRPFVRLVLDAYHRDALSPSSASSLLHLKLKHFPNLEREVGV